MVVTFNLDQFGNGQDDDYITLSDKEVLRRLGMLITTIDNYLDMLSNGHIVRPMRINAAKSGLAELRRQIISLHSELGGENIWEYGTKNEP